MKRPSTTACAATATVCAATVLGIVLPAWPCRASGPYVNGEFRGRIAYSADGNHNDPDDWAASPMVLAIFAESGLKDRLVHFDYNCILPISWDPWEQIHKDSVLGAAERYGYDLSLFHDCQVNADAAAASIARAVDASSAENPLYFIVAGPMQIPMMGLLQARPENRRHVYCISHSHWNDGMVARYDFKNTKRDVIASGVHWVQIQDQNRLLARLPAGLPENVDKFHQYLWMQDSDDQRVRFLFDRMLISARPDPSDSGMAYFLATGDDEATPEKYRLLLDENIVPTPAAARRRIRLEAENFVHLDGFELERLDTRSMSDFSQSQSTNFERASQNVVVRKTDDSGRISTHFVEPYTAARGTYQVEVRYLDEPEKPSTFTLLINGKAQDRPWQSPGRGAGWQDHVIDNVAINSEDEIAVEAAGGRARLDYVELNLHSSPEE